MIKDKFSTLVSAFRSFDKNGDGVIDNGEFRRGLIMSGVDLPEEQIKKMWNMCVVQGECTVKYDQISK